RQGAACVFVLPHERADSALTSQDQFSTDISDSVMEIVRSMALLTALCAEVGWMLPPALCLYGTVLAPVFLRTSRRCLDLCRGNDLLDPDASSVITRYFHGNCMHAGGLIRLSWILLGEAIRIALAMRLYDEAAYKLASAGTSSGNHTPATDLPHSSTTTISPCINLSLAIPFSCPLHFSESTLITGFKLCQRFYYHAAEVIFHMGCASKQVMHDDSHPLKEPSPTQRANLINSYARLTTVLDDALGCLQSFARVDNTTETSLGGDFSLLNLHVQVANLLVTKFYLRMLVTQRCAEDGLQSLLGLPEDHSSRTYAAVRSAPNQWRALGMACSEYHVRGVANIMRDEKIRLIGATLLEIASSKRGSKLI
ncbi:hypothetical protein D6D13_10427, partial [Aureobasidium pullulans]